MGSCCNCSCFHCGRGNAGNNVGHSFKVVTVEKLVTIFVCSATKCDYQSKLLEEVHTHRDSKHGMLNEDDENEDIVVKIETHDTSYVNTDMLLLEEYGIRPAKICLKKLIDRVGEEEEMEMVENPIRVKCEPAESDSEAYDNSNSTDEEDEEEGYEPKHKRAKSESAGRKNALNQCLYDRKQQQQQQRKQQQRRQQQQQQRPRGDLVGTTCKLCNYHIPFEASSRKSYSNGHKRSGEHLTAVQKWKESKVKLRFCGDLICNFTAGEEKEMLNHRKMSHPDQVFVDRTFYEMDEYMKEEKEEDFKAKREEEPKDGSLRHYSRPDKKHECSRCLFRTDCSVGLGNHVDSYHPSEDNNTCSFAGCQFQVPVSNIILKYHQRQQHFPKPVHTCDKCHFKTGTRLLLAEHYTATHSGKIKFRNIGSKEKQLCHDCGIVVVNLEQHISKNHNNKSSINNNNNNCPICNFNTKIEDDLQEHMENCHKDIPIKCGDCEFETRDLAEWRLHQKKDLKSRKILPPTSSFKRRLNNQQQPKKHLCDLCGYSCNVPSLMEIHKQRHHVSLSCQKCDFVAITTSQFKIHMRVAHRNACRDCNVILSRKEENGQHECAAAMGPGTPAENLLSMVTESGNATGSKLAKRLSDNSYLCVECGLHSQKQYIIKRHVELRHSDEKCHLCDYKTTCRAVLLRHVKYSHELKCGDCGKMCKKKEELESHECIPATSEVLKTCPECSYTPKDPKCLARHIDAVHRKVRNAECHICHKKFSGNGPLNAHLAYNHKREKKIYRCDLCDYETRYSGWLKMHARCHPEQTVDTGESLMAEDMSDKSNNSEK